MIVAVAVVAVLLFGGGGGYQVTAEFQNASQLVKGNLVEVGGRQVGKVNDITLEPNGLAAVKFSVDGDFAPLHAGTTATIRANSLSGIANRYVSLQPGPNTADEINSGDHDQVRRDDLGGRPRPDLQHARPEDAARPPAADPRLGAPSSTARASWPTRACTTSRRRCPPPSLVAQELTRDQAEFRRFVTDTSGVVTTIAGRRDDLSALVGNANATTRAIGNENVSLDQALAALPATLRQANTTFVDLNSTLDDLDMLVNASKPATKKLAPFLKQLRPLVRDATPTITDLRHLIRTQRL